MFLMPVNDVVGGSYFLGLMICQMVYGDHFFVMAEHHDSE